IPLPPLSEQRRIAAILDSAEVLHRKRRRSLELFATAEPALFMQFFGEPTKSTDLRDLKSICTTITDGAHKTPDYVPEGIPFVTVKNIASGRLALSRTKCISPQEHAELTKRTRPEQGDILGIKDGTIGSACSLYTERQNTML